MKKYIVTVVLLVSSSFLLLGQINGPTFENGIIRVKNPNNNVKLEKSRQSSYSIDGDKIFNVSEKGDFNKYFPDGKMPPNIILSNEQKGYDKIVLVYQQVEIQDVVYGFVFHYLYSETDEQLLVKYDSDLDNNYNTNSKSIVIENDAYNFTLNYSINEDDFSIKLKNPLRDPALFIKDYYSESSKFSVISDFEFGLGGTGKESYTLSYTDSEVSSAFNYKYEYRTGHFAFSPAIVFKNFGVNINAIYEIRQPRNGLETIYYNNELIRTDNGVANIFPKARIILSYGAFYQILISKTLVIRPYINYGNYSFTGFASNEFNSLRIKKNIIIYGSKFIFPTSIKSGFYLNLSFSNDIYNAVKDIKVRNGNSYQHRLNDGYIANQFNISFGYSIKVF